MRIFYTEVKDNKTGLSMVLAECSYNMAMDWLERELAKYGVVIRHIGKIYHPFELTTIGTEKYNTWEIMRTFYYDEERGYLLGE